MSQSSQIDLHTLEITATSASLYLDACDNGARAVRLNPAYYQACGKLLISIFSLISARETFPQLLERSPAARDVAESIEISRRITVSRLGYYPELSLAMNRAATP